MKSLMLAFPGENRGDWRVVDEVLVGHKSEC